MKKFWYYLNQNQAAFNENLLDKLNIPIIIIDKNYDVIYSNKLFNKIFKGNGKKCYNLIGRDNPCQFCIGSLSFHNKTTNQKEEKINGEYYNITSKLLYDKKNKLIGLVESYLNVSDNRNLESSLLLKNKSLKQDLEVAKQVQKSLLPKTLNLSNIKIEFSYNPCENLGGDFFNYHKIDDEHYAIYMADVSGHGISAAMLTMFIKASINNNLRSPAKILIDLFNTFNNYSFSANRYITMFYLIINIKTRKVKYCNAGHNCPLIIYNYFTGKTKNIESSGIPISSWMEKPDYSDHEFLLEDGYRIFLYTDGITEARNSKNEDFDNNKLRDALLDGNPSLSSSLKRIINYIELFTDKEITNFDDDVSMAIIDLD